MPNHFENLNSNFFSFSNLAPYVFIQSSFLKHPSFHILFPYFPLIYYAPKLHTERSVHMITFCIVCIVLSFVRNALKNRRGNEHCS